MKNSADIVWNDEYLLGDEYIDQQHKQLFEIAQKAKVIHKIKENEEKKIKLRKIMTELYQYINYHFECEEKLMKKINYPLTSEHLKLHKKMKDQINFINFNLITMDISQAEKKLYNFIQKIFVDHIINEDTKVLDFSNR